MILNELRNFPNGNFFGICLLDTVGEVTLNHFTLFKRVGHKSELALKTGNLSSLSYDFDPSLVSGSHLTTFITTVSESEFLNFRKWFRIALLISGLSNVTLLFSFMLEL